MKAVQRILAVLAFLLGIGWLSNSFALAQESTDPVINWLDVGNGQEGDILLIQGENFGDSKPEDAFVAFQVQNLVPGDNAKILSWSGTRIQIEIPRLTHHHSLPWSIFVGLGLNGPFSNWVDFHPLAPTAPQVRVENFKGTPQWHQPEIFNSGTLTVTIDLNGHVWSELNEGKVHFRTEDGRVDELRSMWKQREGNIWEWAQYIPFNVVEVWVETELPLEIEGFGPWTVNESNNGVVKTEQVSTLNFALEGPYYNDWSGQYNPTWSWRLVVNPSWAANQYPWLDTKITVATNCNGHADNHEGNFYWDGVSNDQIFGNGAYRQWVMIPSVETSATISAAGWQETVPTQGPSCWNSISYLPAVSR